MMKKTIILSGALLLGLSAFTGNAQQLPNVGFESWKTTCGNTRPVPGDDRQRPGVEPTGWNGSNVNQYVIFDKTESGLVTQQTDGSNKYAQLKNIYIGVSTIGSVAPGFINFGTPWVYASTNVSDCDGGVFGGTEFTKKPDAITGRYKRTYSNNESSHIIAYLWNGTFTSKIGNIAQTKTESQNDVDRVVMGKATGSASGKLVASCDSAFTSTKDGGWETITVPLKYVADAGEPAMMNVIVSAGDYWNRNNMQRNTSLLVDDVDFVYYSTLTELNVGGTDIALQDGVYTYNVAGQMPTADAVAATCKSQFATAKVTVDDANYQVKIEVTNQGGKDLDGQTAHTYVLQYKAQTQQVYNGLLNVQLGGTDLIANVEKSVTITYYNDGTCDFVLPNFSALGIPLGDISVPNVKVTEDASGNKTFTDGEVEAMQLAGGEIVAHVVLNGGTITADGVINMPITVGWMMNYPDSKAETPISVLFSSDVKYSDKENGYYHVLDADKNIWNVPTTFKSWQYGEGDMAYAISIDGVKVGDLNFGDLKVTGLEESEKVFSGTDAAVVLPNGKTASVTVDGGMVAEADKLNINLAITVDGKLYKISYTTDRQYQYNVDGYYHVLDADNHVLDDKTNTGILAQNVPTTFKAWQYSDGEKMAYAISLDGVKAGDLDFGDLKLTDLTFKDEEFTGTDAAVALPGGKTASVEVKKGNVADVERLKLEFIATVDGKPYAIWFTTNTTTTGVDGVAAAQTAVTAGEGVIRVSGFAGVVDVYTADGRKVASVVANGEAQVAVAAGIYVVRAGDKAAKVIVK